MPTFTTHMLPVVTVYQASAKKLLPRRKGRKKK